MKQNTNITKISVGVLVFKENSILFGKSKTKEGKTRYILPVGHLEYLESFSNCAQRELKEECGIEIKDIQLQYISNTDQYKDHHYVHIGLTAKWKSGEPQVLEPGGIEVWEWRDRTDIPKELSIGAKLTIQALEEGLPMYEIIC